jgi:hypothetical protein
MILILIDITKKIPINNKNIITIDLIIIIWIKIKITRIAYNMFQKNRIFMEDHKMNMDIKKMSRIILITYL